VTNFFYYISSKPASYWGEITTSETCYLFFWIKYKGDILPEDVEYVKVTALDEDFIWTIVPTAENFDRDYITSRYLQRFGPDGYKMPIGWYRAEIALKNGEKSSINKEILLPGGKKPENGIRWVYTEECNLTPENAVLLQRPVITDSSKNECITIKFTTTDTNSFNGWVWFRNTNNAIIAGSNYLVYTCYGIHRTVLNNGDPLHTDGTENIIILNSDEIEFDEGATLSDLKSFSLVITDGEQFLPDSYCSFNYEISSETESF
jgi:hypothetical protein